MRGGIRRFSALVLAVALCAVSPPLTPSTPWALLGSPSSAHAAANDNTPWVLPTRPQRCSSKQIDSGTVAGCLLSGYDAPDAIGWPSPPFPSDPTSGSDVAVIPYAGWTYTGYGYNGSPALAG